MVQQKQGRVQPTTQMQGIGVNNDTSLEKEANVMGEKIYKRTPNKTGKTKQISLIGEVMQRFRHVNGFIESNDKSIIINPNRKNVYVKRKFPIITEANNVLAANKSNIKLQITKEVCNIPNYVGFKPIDIRPQIKTFKMSADCGRAAAEVLGVHYRSMQTVCTDSNLFNFTSTLTNSLPNEKKIELQRAMLEDRDIDINNSLNSAEQVRFRTLNALFDSRSIIADQMYTLGDLYSKVLNTTNVNPDLNLNEKAVPKVGEAYAISSGGNKSESQRTWGHHFAAVIMQSKNKQDHVVLENYATGTLNEVNNEWQFDMIGTIDPNQTFHSMHKSSGQHGDNPTTMVVKRPDIIEPQPKPILTQINQPLLPRLRRR